MARRFCRWAASAYDGALGSYPIPVKMATVAGLTCAGDFSAQSIQACSWQAGPCFDGQRAFAFTSFATLFSGVGGHFWYNLMEKLLPQAAGGWQAALAKVFITQAGLNSLGYVPAYYFWTGAFQGRTLEQSANKLRSEYWQSLMAIWSTFGLANILLFKWIPARYQVSVISLAFFIWSIRISLIANKDAVATQLQLEQDPAEVMGLGEGVVAAQ